MAKEVVLTPLAELEYEQITDYVFNKFGITATNNFIDHFELICSLIASCPDIYPYVDKTKNIRKCVVTKHNVVYFKELENAITIITIFDTRQDPDKLTPII